MPSRIDPPDGYVSDVTDESKCWLLVNGDGLLGKVVLHAEALVYGLQDVAVMREPVEERGGHLGVAEHAGPFAEAEVGGDNDVDGLV